MKPYFYSCPRCDSWRPWKRRECRSCSFRTLGNTAIWFRTAKHMIYVASDGTSLIRSVKTKYVRAWKPGDMMSVPEFSVRVPFVIDVHATDKTIDTILLLL